MSKRPYVPEPFLDTKFHINHHFATMRQLTKYYSTVLRYFQTQIIDPRDFDRINQFSEEVQKIEKWLEDKKRNVGLSFPSKNYIHRFNKIDC